MDTKTTSMRSHPPAPDTSVGSVSDGLVRFRHKWIPTHIVGELLSKSWIDNIVPAAILVLIIVIFGSIVPNFFLPANVSDGTRQIGELGFVVLGMMVVVVGGGIDLSVGSNFALGNLLALALTNMFDLPIGVVFLAVVGTCSLMALPFERRFGHGMPARHAHAAPGGHALRGQ